MEQAAGTASGPRKVPRVVIVGAGFGGLWAADGLGDGPVDVLLIDRNNYHTFMPLLYQVAAALLGADQTVTPVRRVLRKHRNTGFLTGEVTAVDLERRMVRCEGTDIPYDYLVLAAGAASHFFGIPGAEDHALPLRSLEQAVDIRNSVLQRWEEASREPDPERRQALLTVAIVGAGATGVEFAGAVNELFRVPLHHDFPELEDNAPRIVLLEAMDQALPGMPRRLGDYAVKRLRQMGVDVRLKSMVSEVTPDCVRLKDGTSVAANTVVWTAGVAGQPLAEETGLSVTKQRRIEVQPSLQTPDHPEVYVIGDLASVQSHANEAVPMLAAAAIQQGRHAALNILRQVSGQQTVPFKYKDRGMLAVIGRNAAVARVWKLSFTGFPAWLLWAGVHLVQLIGFRNRVVVFIHWAWDYLFFERAVRIILPSRRALPLRQVGGHETSATAETDETPAPNAKRGAP